MLFKTLAKAALLSCAAVKGVSAMALRGKPSEFIKRGPLLQDIVTYDEVCSIFVAGLINRALN